MYSDDALTMREAYQEMLNGKVVYSVDYPQLLYYIIRTRTPLGPFCHVFWQRGTDGVPNLMDWRKNTDSEILRYKIWHRTED